MINDALSPVVHVTLETCILNEFLALLQSECQRVNAYREHLRRVAIRQCLRVAVVVIATQVPESVVTLHRRVQLRHLYAVMAGEHRRVHGFEDWVVTHQTVSGYIAAVVLTLEGPMTRLLKVND